VEPRHEHWIAAKHVLRYIRGTINYGLRYTASSDIQLHEFTDSAQELVPRERSRPRQVCQEYYKSRAPISHLTHSQKHRHGSVLEYNQIANKYPCPQEGSRSAACTDRMTKMSDPG
jgi:hypothetical protein